MKSSDHNIQLPGLTQYNSDQLFFIQYAQVWCEVANQEGHRKSLHDNHSPGKYRANGGIYINILYIFMSHFFLFLLLVLINSEQFARAFECPQNSTMNPIRKCSLWTSKHL